MLTNRKHEFALSSAQMARLDRAAVGARVVRIRTQSAAALRRLQLQQEANTQPRRIHPVGYLPATPTAFDYAWWRSSDFARVRERELAELWFTRGRDNFVPAGGHDGSHDCFELVWQGLNAAEHIAERHFAKYWFNSGHSNAASESAASHGKAPSAAETA